ncbi:FAD-binding oxidoreductase [Labedaea rhizosphaerae]|uniref:FAD/FMN-containing dehydrogenase n=1 Tax=Labedaea rhizosphaerae TaxID=598644 RepID=A0A4R6S5Y9_LABRH|nr:FAD-binding oxidoreductase [Labedaea rhizosphaerae]TDP95192.1 FAD/FMN-containing dehydrogenase [Labedaea rhizosphaerae]
MTNWGELRRAVTGAVVTSDNPDYDAVRVPAMANYADARPAVVVRAATQADVVAAIRFARGQDLRLTARSGGHCFAGRSSAGDIVLDLSGLRDVTWSDGLAEVGAGVRLPALYESLAAHGVTVPGGCGPTVGVAGLTLGGGIGVLGRRYGLTCDRLRRAEVVLADGTTTVCDTEHEPELFWALRGAGGGLVGVVTSFVFETVPAPQTACVRLAWPARRALDLAEAWQSWAPAAPDPIAATLRLTTTGALLDATAAGADPEPSIGEFVRLVGAPSTDERIVLPYKEAKQHLAGPPAEAQGHFVGRSEFFAGPIPRAALAEVIEALPDGAELSFTPLGGEYARVPGDATAFAHRAAAFVVEHTTEAPPAELPAATRWAETSARTLHPHGTSGVYANFPVPGTDPLDPRYHGANRDRLLRVLDRYDPGRWFTATG